MESITVQAETPYPNLSLGGHVLWQGSCGHLWLLQQAGTVNIRTRAQIMPLYFPGQTSPSLCIYTIYTIIYHSSESPDLCTLFYWKERKKKMAVTLLEEEGKGWLPTFPSEQSCKAKALPFPFLWDHPGCTCRGILQLGTSSSAAVPGPFAGRLGSHSSPPSSRHLSGVGTKAHRSRQLNQSTNWGGECAPTSLLKCISITRGGWKTIGFEEESWWWRKIVSYLRRMELSRCGQSVQRV